MKSFFQQIPVISWLKGHRGRCREHRDNWALAWTPELSGTDVWINLVSLPGRLLPILSLVLSLPYLTVQPCPTLSPVDINATGHQQPCHPWPLHLPAAHTPLLLSLPLPVTPKPVLLLISPFAPTQFPHISSVPCSPGL